MTAESETLLSHSPTEAAFIIRAAPHLLSPDQEDSMTGHPNISGNDAPFDEFIEVINDCQHKRFTGSAALLVKGSLMRNISFWHAIGAPEFIYRSFKVAIVFLLGQLPPGTFSKTTSLLCLIQNLSVEETILELLNSYRVVEVQAPQLLWLTLYLSVQSNGKKRLILYVRYVNKHLIKQRVKYEDWKTALSYF